MSGYHGCERGMISHNSERKYPYTNCCVDTPPEDVDALNDMCDRSREITWEQFKRSAAWESVACALGYGQGPLTLGTDQAVSFHRSRYKGRSCVYFVWSAIEFYFVRPNAQEMQQLHGQTPPLP